MKSMSSSLVCMSSMTMRPCWPLSFPLLLDTTIPTVALSSMKEAHDFACKSKSLRVS
jgi:hypothetical protein